MQPLRSFVRARLSGARLLGEEGSALTELAIVAPLFILLLYWSQFFTDLSIVKLKAEEAARYAAWEITAQRDTAQVQTETATRFQDLSGADRDSGAVPRGVLSFSAAASTSVRIEDNLAAIQMTGNIQRPSGGGVLSQILGYINGLLNRAVSAILRQYQFNQNGRARATVTMNVQNTLFPTGSRGIWSLIFDSQFRARPITVTAVSPGIIADTWKAWPSRYWARSGRVSDAVLNDVNARPADTYARGMRNDQPKSGQAGIPDRVVAERMKRVAFFGFSDNGLARGFNQVASFLGFPSPLNTGHFLQDQGPIVMLPGATQRHSWSPGSSSPLQRIGSIWWNQSTTYDRIDSPDPGVDRARYTVPGRVSSDWWTKDGGFTRTRMNSLNNSSQNPYMRMYDCRDSFYLGSYSSVNRWGNTLGGWVQSAYRGCR